MVDVAGGGGAEEGGSVVTPESVLPVAGEQAASSNMIGRSLRTGEIVCAIDDLPADRAATRNNA